MSDSPDVPEYAPPSTLREDPPPLWVRLAPFVAVPLMAVATTAAFLSPAVLGPATPGAPTPEASASGTPLILVGRTRLGGSQGIRTGFTSSAARAVHELVRAFEGREVEEFARLVDIEYDLDYHRMLHDLEGYFLRHDRVQMNMQLEGVEPLPVGFMAEVHWEKVHRVKKTRALVHQEGIARLFFTGGEPPRLRSVRGEMPF